MRSMLRAVSVDLIRWAPVGPWGSYGFCRSDGRRYDTRHLATLTALWQALEDGLLTVDEATQCVSLTQSGWAALCDAAATARRRT